MIRSEVSRALSSIQRGGTFDLQASDELIDDMRNFTSLISRKKYKEKRQGALDEQLKKSEAKSRLYNKSYRRRWNSGTSGASDASTPTPSLSSNPTAKLRKHESTRRRTAPISSSLSVKPRPRPRVRTGTGSSRRDRVKKEVLSRGRRRRSSTGLGGPNPYRSLVEEELKSSNSDEGLSTDEVQYIRRLLLDRGGVGVVSAFNKAVAADEGSSLRHQQRQRRGPGPDLSEYAPSFLSGASSASASASLSSSSLSAGRRRLSRRNSSNDSNQNDKNDNTSQGDDNSGNSNRVSQSIDNGIRESERMIASMSLQRQRLSDMMSNNPRSDSTPPLTTAPPPQSSPSPLPSPLPSPSSSIYANSATVSAASLSARLGESAFGSSPSAVWTTRHSPDNAAHLAADIGGKENVHRSKQASLPRPLPSGKNSTRATDDLFTDIDDADLPNAFSCPITYEVMREPVVACDGHTYERAAIEQWLRKRDRSPMTGQTLQSKVLTPNFSLRSMIRAELEKRRREKRKCAIEVEV